MVIHSTTDYACSLAKWRATQNTCTNSLTVKRSVVESLLLKAIQEDLFMERDWKSSNLSSNGV